jgi:cell surface protein SprA
VSLNQQLQPDEVLGVAYQYTFNGKVYQVGEFAQDVTFDSTQGVQKVLFLKIIKSYFSASCASNLEMDDEKCLFS